jgi:hypothetical protein
MAGFDAISNHVGLIFFSVTLDLLLWIGPRLSVAQLVESFFLRAATLAEVDSPEMANVMSSNREIWQLVAERFNLFSVLRTFPVGIPSLMVSRAPLAVPGGDLSVLEMPSFGVAIGLWILLSLIGLVAGTLYFAAVAQAALDGKVQWGQIMREWPRNSLQVLLLALFWLALLLGIGIPLSCLFSFFILSGVQVGPFAVLLVGLLMAWIFLPLVLSPHGIFVNGRAMWASVVDSMRLTRRTLTTTALFFLMIIILSEGLDVLWRIPAEDSWLAIIGVAGHAFITAGLLAATFVYYRDAETWMHRVIQQVQLSSRKNA